jgi:DNA-binding NarL/FixJ family response regulator
VIRVLIADDHAIVREGIGKVLSEAPDIEVVAQAASSQEALEQARATEPDVVLLDVTMPGRGGLETLKEIRRLLPAIRVLILSMHPEDQFAVRFLKDGAAGYVTKESASEQLIAAIRKVHRGGKYVSPALAEQLVASLDPDHADRPHERLSDREFQVFHLLASGKTVGEIAAELYLSVKTISTYRARVLEKLGLKNNAQLMRYAFEAGLVKGRDSLKDEGER